MACEKQTLNYLNVDNLPHFAPKSATFPQFAASLPIAPPFLLRFPLHPNPVAPNRLQGGASSCVAGEANGVLTSLGGACIIGNRRGAHLPGEFWATAPIHVQRKGANQ